MLAVYTATSPAKHSMTTENHYLCVRSLINSSQANTYLQISVYSHYCEGGTAVSRSLPSECLPEGDIVLKDNGLWNKLGQFVFTTKHVVVC